MHYSPPVGMIVTGALLFVGGIASAFSQYKED